VLWGFFANLEIRQTAKSFGCTHLHSQWRSSLRESRTQLKYQKRSATVAEATAKQKKGPADIMSAEVRNCWQKPEWQREPAKYTWSNTRKTRNSKRDQKADGTEKDDFFGHPHGTTLPDITTQTEKSSLK
jgi:hypothetical protein